MHKAAVAQKWKKRDGLFVEHMAVNGVKDLIGLGRLRLAKGSCAAHPPNPKLLGLLEILAGKHAAGLDGLERR